MNIGCIQGEKMKAKLLILSGAGNNALDKIEKIPCYAFYDIFSLTCI